MIKFLYNNEYQHHFIIANYKKPIGKFWNATLYGKFIGDDGKAYFIFKENGSAKYRKARKNYKNEEYFIGDRGTYWIRTFRKEKLNEI